MNPRLILNHVLYLSIQVTGLSELIPAFLSAETQASNSRNWRLHADILDKFSALPRCLTSDQIHNKFVPLVYKQITTHVSPLISITVKLSYFLNGFEVR